MSEKGKNDYITALDLYEAALDSALDKIEELDREELVAHIIAYAENAWYPEKSYCVSEELATKIIDCGEKFIDTTWSEKNGDGQYSLNYDVYVKDVLKDIKIYNIN